MSLDLTKMDAKLKEIFDNLTQEDIDNLHLEEISTEDLDPEFSRIVDENFYNMLDKEYGIFEIFICKLFHRGSHFFKSRRKEYWHCLKCGREWTKEIKSV